MFGYVTANEPELKVKDYHKYKSVLLWPLPVAEETVWQRRTAYACL